MSPEVTQPELPLMAGAVAIGAVCAIVAVLFLFPVIDRLIRPKFDLERGTAMVVLLLASVFLGALGGVFSFFQLRDREAEERQEPPVEEGRRSTDDEERQGR